MFEGGDGAGKTTQLRLLHEALVDRGHDVVRTREPGGTPLGEAVRGLLLQAHSPSGPDLPIGDRTEALLFAAARAQHVDELIRPAVAAGKLVLSDRFVDSSLAYQGAARGLGLGPIQQVNEWATAGLLPDLTIVLDLPVAQARERMADRAAATDRIEAEADAFHETIRQTYLALAQQSPERYLVLDARQDPEALAAAVLARVSALVNRGGGAKHD